MRVCHSCILLVPLILPNLCKTAEVVEVIKTAFATEPTIEETSSLSLADVNAWVGRKIDASAIIQDIKNEETKTENDIPIDSDEERHPCNRRCTSEGTPMLCRYFFKVEWYQTLSKACYDCPYNLTDCTRPHCIASDGVKRPILVVNRSMPGPAIEVCLNDEVIVEVDNALLEEGTSIHWHGHHQRGTPYMDGVPFVTQCPISSKAKFTYRFKADNPGTHFWHSHSALQRGDGMFGGLIVRVPPELDPHRDLYDFDLPEHKMIILDWTHAPGITKFVAHHHSDGNNKPESILVNGKGRYVEFVDDKGGIHMTPMERFTVSQGLRYRFRIINAGFLNCPIEISIDNHTMVIVSSDGFDLEPEEATSLVTYAGERFDIIVQMNQSPSNYWIRYRGLMDCDERFTSAIQMAILHYRGAEMDGMNALEEPTYDNSKPHGLQINSLNSGYKWNNSLSLPELKSLEIRSDDTLKTEADLKFFIDYDFYPLDNPFMHHENHYGFHQVSPRQRVFTPQLNHISMKLPEFPLMVEQQAAKKLEYCNQTSISKDCTKSFCECTHLLKIPLGAVVELILVDKGFTYDANHPFHLHGYAFRVLGMDRLGSNVTVEEVKKLDAEGKLLRNFKSPPFKDTVTVPDGGYTVLRWQANNPGYWLFHCHIEYHVELGMAIVFKVGEEENYPPVPRRFPRCNNAAHMDLDLPQSPRRTKISEIDFNLYNTFNVLSNSGSTELLSTKRFLLLSLVLLLN